MQPAYIANVNHPYYTTDSIIPTVRHPYYIVAANYQRTSAGIKAMHMLCHALNRRGERAYIILHPHYPGTHGFHFDWLTPPLGAKTIAADFARGLTPISIYSESVSGNIFNSPLVVRYILNFPGLLGGESSYRPEEYLLAYSSVLAEKVGCPDSVLFIPTSDTSIFTAEPRQARSGSCFYASKYQHFHKGVLFPETANSVEITRDLPDSPSPQDIAELFRKSEVFYCYENSALIIEALLCECPVVMLPNPYLERPIGDFEIGRDGIAWGTDPKEVHRAKCTVIKGKERYLETYANFWIQLDRFIATSQARAATTPYATPMRLSYSEKRTFLNWVSDASRMLDFIIMRKGIWAALRHTIGWIKRRGLGILP
jgi:hypothetical protein